MIKAGFFIKFRHYPTERTGKMQEKVPEITGLLKFTDPSDLLLKEFAYYFTIR